MTINEIQDEVIEEFADFDDWMDKYQMLIDLGNDLGTLDEKYKTEQNLIDGCQSRVWLQCDYVDGKFAVVNDKLCAQAVHNATNDAVLGCMQGQIAALMGLTKTVIPTTSICPEVMPKYNSWTAPTATAGA